ncbi:MAG TPA: serine/threonine-protein kinase [Kofleriaceae bacterium]|jgi:serine/threonine-protein kinase
MVDDDPAHAETLSEAAADTSPEVGRGAPRSGDLDVHIPPAGYRFHEVIGLGGMGEVVAATDDRIGRDVAIKRMRDTRPDAQHVSRFLREARIQARLDHPAIVPVHELGTDTAGRPYFVMKRISGRTLAQYLVDGAPSQRMLRTLVDVCLAIDLAHSRGVIHRDLKPANIMLGDYGEVYVLDWGVARVQSERSEQSIVVRADIDTPNDGTQAGSVLGTPGYMAPEVITGEPAQGPADVYALGCILFEILSEQPLHPRGTPAIATTLASPQERPTQRVGDRSIPPELDRLCFEALAQRPGERPTARQFADRIQKYLDGDRDLASRRAAAEEQFAKARDALAADPREGRQEAIARAGSAIALAPDWAEPRLLVTELIVRPGETLPAELIASLKEEEVAATKQRSHTAFVALAGLLFSWLVIPFLGIQSWPWLLALYGSLLLHTGYTWRASKTGSVNVPLGLVTSTIFIVCTTRLAGIWMITPILICGVLLGFTAASVFLRRKWLLPVWTCLAFGVPVVLEWTHVIPKSWQVNLDDIVSISSIFRMHGWYADAALIGTNIALLTLVGVVMIRLHHAQRRAARQLSIQNWHMNQLVPRDRRAWATQPQPSLS